MGKEVYKKYKGKLLLVNCLGKFERLNGEEWRLLEGRAVKGIMPVYTAMYRKRTMVYTDITSLHPLSAYLRGAMRAETALMFLQNTVHIAHACECYGLRIDCLCWDPSRIYVDDRGVLTMVYWPVITLEPTAHSAFDFFYQFCTVLAYSNLPSSLYAQYYNYFYQRTTLDFPDFFGMVQLLLRDWQEFCTSEKQKKMKNIERKEKDSSGKIPERTLPPASYLQNTRTGEKMLLSCDYVTFGRDPQHCQVCLAEYKGISRQHAVVFKKGERYYIMDLDSRNGTYLRGIRLPANRRVALQDGDILRIGPLTWRFCDMRQNYTMPIHQPKGR